MNYILLAFLSTLGTWFLTASGSAMVFFFKKLNDNIMNACLGFSSGIMIAASFFSLLKPAVELSDEPKWIPVALGFILGGLSLILLDIFIKKLQKDQPMSFSEKRTFMLISAITMHNIPEGLVVGVAFGALKDQALSLANILPALSIALGIGLQNFPEGAAVSLPLRREGHSRLKSFFYGQLSGIVEPIFGILGALLIGFFTALLPYALAFAAGAMIFVVVKELIPEAEKNNGYLPSLGCISGFTLMMILDVALS